MGRRGEPGKINTLPIPADEAEDGYGSDPFADMDDGEAFQLEVQARTRQVALKRACDEPVQRLPRKRRATTQQARVPLARSSPSSSADYGSDPFEGFNAGELKALEVPPERSLRASSEDYGSDPFEEFSAHDLSTLERKNPSARQSSSQGEDRPVGDKKLQRASPGTGSVRGDVDGPGVSTGQSQSTSDVDSKKPLDGIPWPPEADLKIYSHDFKVNREFYQKILQRVSLSGQSVYNINKERFDRGPTPDLPPFLASDSDKLFRFGGGKILLPSNVCILGGFDGEIPVYYSVDGLNLSKSIAAERKLLGLDPVARIPLKKTPQHFFRDNYARLTIGEKRAVLERYEARIENVHAIKEFAFELKDNGHVSIDGKAFRSVGDLDSDQRRKLLERRIRRCPESAGEIFISRDQPPAPFFLACNILTDEIGLSSGLVTADTRRMPLVLDRLQHGDLFQKGEASLSPATSLCMLVDIENGAKYHRLNRHQAALISHQEKCQLGFEPSWTHSLTHLERYQFGLLPPKSEALADAEKLDPDLALYLADRRNEAKLIAQENDSARKSGADNSSTVSAPPGAAARSAMRERSRSSGFSL